MEAVASVILEKLAEELTEAIKNQAQYAIDFKSDLKNLKDKLKIVNGFFADMDKLKEKKQVLKEALSQLRDLAYDADDILTDCMIREEYKKDGHCFSLNDPIFGYKTGRKLKDLNSRMQNVEDSMNKYLNSQSQQLNKNEGSMDKGLFISQHLTSSDSLVGLEEDIRKLKKWILCENRLPLQFVGIVGMGGSGKTTLAWEIYNDKEVIDTFKQNRIWLTVSQDCNEESIIKSILEELKKQQQEETQGGDDHESFCLVILDDIWNVFNLSHWQDLCSSLEKKRGQNTCIIITTRIEEVAIGMRVNSSRIHYPKALEDEKSWLLFHKVAFSPNDDICKAENIIEVGKKIVKKCGGLPLAIKTIAALLKSKRQLNEWEKVYDEFQKLTQEKVPVMASLQLSYDALPRHLKQFLLSFSIYPEDFEIRAEQLVHWWVGEGLIKSQNSKTAMDLGYECLADLAGRCLVEVVRRRGYDGKVHSCKMHDLVRDLTIKIAGEEELCSFESRGKQRQLIMQDSRWLGITDENISISSLSQCSKLRAILLMSSLSISSNMPISLSSLRVLDLSNGKLDDKSVENLFKWIILLKRLAHLNLSGAPGLKNVPRIRKLRNLQLLVLSGCSNLVSLNDSSIIYLKKLLILDLGSCDSLMFLPQGIGRLTKLEELSGFKLHRRENSQSCGLLELQNLVQLRVLRIKLSDESEILDNEWEALSRLEKLQVLAIDTENTKEPTNLQKLDRLKPPPGLEQVYLRHYRRNHLPEWINPKTLSKLQYLSIEFGDIKHICPNLELREEKWKLVGLCLKFLPLFEDDWKKLKQIMPSLCDVEVSNCPSLKNPPYEDKSWTSRNLLT